MKTNLLSLLLILSSFISRSQSMVDSCFQSASPSVSFSSSTTLVNAVDADLVEWTGTQWNGSWSTANVNLAPPCDQLDARAIWMGDQTFWTSGGEGFAAKLDQSLVSGTTYYFTFTYASNGSYSNGNFSPYFKTNTTSDYFSAYSVGQLTPVGNAWTTNTYSFTATNSQTGHQWIFIHSNNGSGIVLSSCYAGFTIDLGPDTSLCIGDTIELSADAGYDSYTWSTGDTSQSVSIDSAGIYFLQATKGNCTSSDTINISNINCTPHSNFQSSSSSLCEKFCIGYNDMSLHQPTSWLWLFSGGSPASSTEQNPSSICYTEPGTYDVTLITANASGSDTLTLPNYITVYPTPPIPTITQNGYTLTSSAATTYQWQLNTVDIPGATDQSYDVLQTGFYSVIVSDENGCKNSATMYIQITGIDEIPAEEFNVFPNPSQGTFVIRLHDSGNSEKISVRIFNAIGQRIYDDQALMSLSDSGYKIQLHDMADGVYFIEVKAGNNLLHRKLTIAN